MSVCFFVPAAEQGASTSTAEDGVDTAPTSPVENESTAAENTEVALQQFWQKVSDDIRKVTMDDFKSQTLPLARIKKIMKLDEDVKMISAEAPVLFARACEIFIHELTLRAWVHTEDNKRRTLQRNDIAMAISKSDQFDFLIDIVPRYDVKPVPSRPEQPRTTGAPDQYYLQLAQQHQQALQTPQQQVILQPQIHSVQSTSASGNAGQVTQPVTILQSLLQPSGELQQIQLTQAQLNMLRMQMQNNSGQPVIIQTQGQQGQPQIIQVQSTQQQQQQQTQPQQVFITQVASSQDGD